MTYLPMSEAAWREMENERNAGPVTIADAHREWHRNSGLLYGCPWDACQPPEPEPCSCCGDYLYDNAACTKFVCMLETETWLLERETDKPTVLVDSPWDPPF